MRQFTTPASSIECKQVRRVFPATAAAVLVLGGCAGPLPPRFTAEGHLPGGGATYAFAPGVPAAQSDALGRCLSASGMSLAASAPAYVVQVSAARRMGGTQVVGAVRGALPPALPAPAQPQKPWPAKADVEAMALSVSSTAGGQEVYRAGAARIAAAAKGKPQPPLAAALCDGAIARSAR